MVKKTQDLKTQAKLSYEASRIKLSLLWLRYPIFLILISYGVTDWSWNSSYLSAFLLILSSICVWYGKDLADGVKHGLMIGSLGFLMPVLAKLMDSLPHIYHSLLCIALGMLFSMSFWQYLIRYDEPNKISTSYLMISSLICAATASLCCPSIGLGSVGGIFLGVLSLSTSHLVGKLLSRN